ncbi:hypothetical protein D5086_026402 [Populus alba]|uniref:Uncharacterized protein n=1 Tax=Populus alba TaxID=43335 RepID=A0ACC4B1S4_POPAL
MGKVVQDDVSPWFPGSRSNNALAAISVMSTFKCILHAPRSAPEIAALDPSGILSIKSQASSSFPARPRRSTVHAYSKISSHGIEALPSSSN